MKILYLCSDLGIPVLGRKGASVHLRSLVTAFVRAGHSVVLAAPLLNKSPWEGPAKLDVSLLHLPPSADIVNAVLALKAFTEMLGVANPLPWDDVVSLGVKPDRVHVVPSGVDATLFQPGSTEPSSRARWGLGAGPILGFVGGLRRWHGVEALPTLLERLVQRYRGLRLVIVGDGPLRGELEHALKERGLTRSVVFTGSLPHEEVADLIRQFDVALAPYPRPEHAFYFSPLKVFEYMACGIPVVAAGLGQIVEVVRDGETGLLYPPGELDALTVACDRLLADPALRQRLGQAAAKEVHGLYTWDQNAARVVELARALIATRGTGQ